MLSKTTFVFFFIFLTIFSIISSDDRVFCHIYGDPHLIVFNNSQEQYWCRTSGSLTLLSNEFLRIQIQIQNETWTISRYQIEFYKNNATLPCQINHEDQRCDDDDVIITRPNLNQISILYRQENTHISIFEQKSWYDLSIRMPKNLVDQSIGLCVEPSGDECDQENQPLVSSNRSQEICQHYSDASVQLSTRFNFLNNSQRIQNAFRACINDYETTGDYHFGISGVQMIVQNGFHNRQLNDSEFELQTVLNLPTIESILLNATNNIAFLLTNTISTSIITSTIPATSTSSTTIPATSTSDRTISATSTLGRTIPATSSSSTTIPATSTSGRTTHATSTSDRTIPVTSTLGSTTPTTSTSDSITVNTHSDNRVTTTTIASMAAMIQHSIVFVLIKAILLVVNQNFD